jgi:hypothetical protein
LRRLWPVLIIAFGVNLIVGGRTPWLATILIGALLAAAVTWAALLVEPGGELVSTSMAEGLEGVSVVDVEIGFGAGDLKITSLPEGSPNLVEAAFDTPGRGAVTSLRRSDDSADLRFSMESGRWFRSASGAEWEIMLSRSPALSIRLNGGAASMVLDLSDLQVTDLEIATGALGVDVTVPADAGEIFVQIDGGASNIEVLVPDGVAARITSASGLSSINVDRSRFPKLAGVYASPGFEDAANRVNIDIRVGVSSVTVR